MRCDVIFFEQGSAMASGEKPKRSLDEIFQVRPQTQADGEVFQIGDLAWLKSGGPAMTVKKLGEELTCVWFSLKHEYHEASFAPVLLTGSKPVIGEPI